MLKYFKIKYEEFTGATIPTTPTFPNNVYVKAMYSKNPDDISNYTVVYALNTANPVLNEDEANIAINNIYINMHKTFTSIDPALAPLRSSQPYRYQMLDPAPTGLLSLKQIKTKMRGYHEI